MRAAALLLLLATGTAQGAEDPSATEAAWTARLAVGDVEAAVGIVMDEIAARPGAAEPHLWLARILSQEDPPDLDGAEEAARRAFALDSSSPAPLAELARSLRDAGELSRAEAALQEALVRFPRQTDLLRLLGTVRLRQGEAEDSLRILERAAAGAPEDPQVRRDLGLALVAAGRMGRALEILVPVRDAAPSDPEVREALAACYRRVGDDVHEAEELTAAARLREDARWRAEGKRARRALSHRIATLEREAASTAPAPGTFLALWELYTRRGDLEWSLPRLERLAAGHPDSPDARATRGLVLAHAGDQQRARSVFQEVLGSHPAEPAALAGAQQLARTDPDLEELQATAGAALAAAPDSPAAHRFQGFVFLRAGRTEEATRHLEQTVSLDPSDVQALAQLAVMRQDQGDLDGAETLLRRAAEADPQAPFVHVALGLLAARRGDREEAREQLLRAEALGGTHPALFAGLAAVFRAAGDEARAAYYEGRARQAAEAAAVNPPEAG